MYEKYIEDVIRNAVNVLNPTILLHLMIPFPICWGISEGTKYIYRYYCYDIHLVPSFMSCIIDKIRIMILDE